MGFLTDEEVAKLSPAESLFPSPIPVQFVSSDEFMPGAADRRSSASSRRASRRIGAKLAKQHGMSRRAFFKTAGRHGGGVRRDERDLREGRGADLRGGRRARRRTSTSPRRARTR